MQTDWPDHTPDWADTHTGVLFDATMTAREAYELAFSTMPRWVRIALAARNRIVGLFGLKTEGNAGDALMTSLPILQDAPNRYEVGLVDKHLTFTLLTAKSNAQITITTSIWFNHWLGRLYLAIVLIPHKIIVKQSIQRLS